jgi:hypothetical protein
MDIDVIIAAMKLFPEILLLKSTKPLKDCGVYGEIGEFRRIHE